jgi:hypothetical protein
MIVCIEMPDDRKKGPMITPGPAEIRAQQETTRCMDEGLKQLVAEWRIVVDRLADRGFPIQRL